MEVAIHAGVHFTGFSHLQKCLNLNSRNFSRNGVFVADHRQYKHYLLEKLEDQKKNDVDATLDWSKVVAQDIGTLSGFKLVLSSESFFSPPRLAARGGLLYRNACNNIAAIKRLLPQTPIEFFVVIRNPATLLPELFEYVNTSSFMNFVDGADPMTFRWSGLFTEVSERFPNINFHVFCFEDLPLVWGELVRTIGSLDAKSDIRGEFLFLKELMAEEGLTRLSSYFRERSGLSELQRRRIIAAFLEKYAKQEEVEQTIEIPGWTERLVGEMSQQYDDDLLCLQRLPNVYLTTL